MEGWFLLNNVCSKCPDAEASAGLYVAILLVIGVVCYAVFLLAGEPPAAAEAGTIGFMFLQEVSLSVSRIVSPLFSSFCRCC